MLNTGTYGSAINQTFSRSLLSPNRARSTIHSVQRAQGQIGMDDAANLRHAINGTGETSQAFGFVGQGETYYRQIKAKNDGWVSDNVWGSLKQRNPPVKVDGPLGGPGFRR